MRIIEGRRYMYKGVKRGIAIDGNISAYEYILEGMVRLQLGLTNSVSMPVSCWSTPSVAIKVPSAPPLT
jgi:hypothetical protein